MVIRGSRIVSRANCRSARRSPRPPSAASRPSTAMCHQPRRPPLGALAPTAVLRFPNIFATLARSRLPSRLSSPAIHEPTPRRARLAIARAQSEQRALLGTRVAAAWRQSRRILQRLLRRRRQRELELRFRGRTKRQAQRLRALFRMQQQRERKKKGASRRSTRDRRESSQKAHSDSSNPSTREPAK